MSEKKDFDWTGYNKSQMKEKVMFVKLLKELCDTLPEKYRANSRTPMKLRTIIFSICMKSYCRKNGRNIIGEIEICKNLGYFKGKLPHFNTLFNYLKHPQMTLVLQDLIKITSLPLASIETKLCGDSTGIGTRVLHDRWSVVRQNYEKHHKYVKLHASFGTLSNIITSCRVTLGTSADGPMLPTLVNETCENFSPEEYSWDMAYLSRDNLETIWNHNNCLPLIPFKSNCVAKRGNMIWKEMYNYFHQNREGFMKKYHLRSNSESGFHALKAKFGDLTCMRNDIGMVNDVLTKCLTYNLCVLVKSFFILGVEIDFAQFKKHLAQDYD